MSASGLFETVKDALHLANDAELARRLDFAHTVISSMRAGRVPVSLPMIISIHEETGWPTKKIKAYINFQDSATP